MVDNKSSDLRRALLASPAGTVVLPDPTYQRWMLDVVGETSIFSTPCCSLVPVAPRVTYLPTHCDRSEWSKALALKRWEVGCTPTGLVDTFGLSEKLLDFVVHELVPRCAGCASSMRRPRNVGDLSLPQEGYLLATPAEGAESISLRQQCEMLGSERALVGAKIVRAESLAEESGAPIVALVSARDVELFHELVESWFTRGGGALAIHHATTRESEVASLDSISSRWRCDTCATSVEQISRLRLVDVAPCAVCRGEGWLLDRSGRLAACRECDGFGSDDEIGSYDLRGVPLCRVGEISFAALKVMVEQSEACKGEELLAALSQIEEFGFGAYPLASPTGTLSEGERVLATAVIGHLSRVTGARYVVDGAHLQEESLSSLSQKALESLQRVVPERGGPFLSESARSASAESIRLIEVYVGGLRIQEVEFPLGALSFIKGQAGTGKSLLLAEIGRRFTTRKKMAHTASFGRVKRCHRIGAASEPMAPLLTLLAIEDALAQEIAATRMAQIEGITTDDLALESTRYRCGVCQGRGVVTHTTQSGTENAVVCEECQGALFDWRVAELPLFGGTVGGVLRTPLRECADFLWRDQSISAMLLRVADGFERALTLSTPVAELSAEERGFATVVAHLARIAAAPKGTRVQHQARVEELLLVDGPRVLTSRHAATIQDLLRDLVDSGATIICADPAQGLESLGASVLRLQVEREPSVSKERRSFADSRFARTSVIGGNEA